MDQELELLVSSKIKKVHSDFIAILKTVHYAVVLQIYENSKL